MINDGFMRDFNRLDAGAFRGFYYAAETLNFTVAAQRAGMTQSGVSQHISKLETQLGVPLFLRVGRKVILTDAGKKLKDYIEQYLDQQELLAESVSTGHTALKGRVNYAMPASCLMTPHFPILLRERRKRFPELELNVTLCPSDEVIEKLLDGEIEFGFVTKKTQHLDIHFTPFCPEEYVLIADRAEALDGITSDSLKASNFVAHPGVEVLFSYWVGYHFPRAKNLHWGALKVVGQMNSLQGAIHMVEASVGLTVIPRHCVDDLIAKNRVYEYRGTVKKPLQNMIYIITLANAQLPRRVRAVLDVFLTMKNPRH
jgi:DNA-binding transcriptional LysR family regulator